MSGNWDAKDAQRALGSNPMEERSPKDFYETPIEAIVPLLTEEFFDGVIWEPACGKGAISEIISGFGYKVYSSDLYDWGYGDVGVDFLNCQLPDNVTNIITNPPFSLSDDFMTRGLAFVEQTQGKLVLFNRLQYLEGVKRKPIFENSNLSKVYVFSRRVPRMDKLDYTGPRSTTMMAFAWFVWDYNKPQENPIIKWIDWKDYV